MNTHQNLHDLRQQPPANPRIVAFAPQQPLVDAAADFLLTTFRPNPNAPETLAQVLVLLPTRRAVRALREALLRHSDGAPMLLPRMIPLGEAAEDTGILAEMLGDALVSNALLALPPAMEEAERQLRMTQLLRALEPTRPLEQQAGLAQSLLQTLDECQRYGCTPETLAKVVPDAYAQHWQRVLAVLQVMWTMWPQLVAEAGKIDPMLRRNAMLDLVAQHWQTNKPAQPVVAVGDWDAQPCIHAVLAALARHSNGWLLMTAMDAGLAPEMLADLPPEHPAYAYRQLCRVLGIEQLRPQLPPSPRALLWQEAMLPAAHTDQWRAPQLTDEQLQKAVRGLHSVEAPHRGVQAHAIALLLREALHTPEKTAALITPDRMLAEQVRSALAGQGIVVDDSAGKPLLRTPPGQYLQLCIDAVASGCAPIPLLEWLQHPLTSAGFERTVWLRHVRALDKYCLRGTRPAFGIAGIRSAIASAKLTDAQREEMLSWLGAWLPAVQALEEVLVPDREQPLATLLQTHIACAEAMSRDAEGVVQLWHQPESQSLSTALEEWLRHAPHLQPMDSKDYAALLVVLMAGQQWRPRYGGHPRLHILSPQEAQLQRFDRVVLGGLNDGCWPMLTESGPWMSRPMRAEAELPSLELQLGAQASAFLILACQPEVYVCHSAKDGGTLATPSRYLQRLKTLLKAYGQQGMFSRIEENAPVHWVRLLTQHTEEAQPCPRPVPCPPLAARPRTLAVTRLTLLQKNAYDFYASQILKLYPIEPRDSDPDPRALGMLLHTVLENFTRQFPSGWDDSMAEALHTMAQQALEIWRDHPMQRAFSAAQWRALSEWLIPLERTRRAECHHITPEQRLTLPVHHAAYGDVTLTARVDRVETLRDGSVRLVDYKTGTIPTAKSITNLTELQLPLQGWMVQHGALTSTTLNDMEWWQIKPHPAKEVVALSGMLAKHSGDIYAQAGERLHDILARYANPDQGYAATPAPANQSHRSDYAHLARVGEWEQ